MKNLIEKSFQKVTILIFFFSGFQTFSQPYPNPYKLIENWAKLPDGRIMGAAGKVTADPDGEHIWAVIRYDDTEPDRFGDECRDSELDPIINFDQEGNVVQSFGDSMFIWPHVLDVVKDGNVWVTESVSDIRIPEGDERGHQVFKFSLAGEVLMVLGKPGVAGAGDYEFNAPSDVAIADNGDIFIADGHSHNTNNRVMKYSSDSTFIKSWEKTGYGPGEFKRLHALDIDSRGRLFVADRGNKRLQIFDQEGNFIAQLTQFGMPSGCYTLGIGKTSHYADRLLYGYTDPVGTETAEVSGNVARLKGNLVKKGDMASVKVGFEYRPYAGFVENLYNTDWEKSALVEMSEEKEFSIDIDILKPGKHDEYRAVVVYPQMSI